MRSIREEPSHHEATREEAAGGDDRAVGLDRDRLGERGMPTETGDRDPIFRERGIGYTPACEPQNTEHVPPSIVDKRRSGQVTENAVRIPIW